MKFDSHCLRLLIYGALIPSLSGFCAAQGRELKKAGEAKELVEQEKENESEVREETVAELDEEREEVIEKLESLQKRYDDKGMEEEADAISAQIKAIENRIGTLERGERPSAKSAAKPVPMFLYDKTYFFSYARIKGSLKFMRNGKANVTYKMGKEQHTRVWSYTLHDDHVEILGDEQLGKIYLSEVPSKKPKALMVRWGGKLLHELSIAETK